MGVAGNQITWTDVKEKPKDETGCYEPKFPFLLLREKPLVF